MSQQTERIAVVAEALRRNNVDAFCLERADEVVPLIQTLIRPGDVVAIGGSRSLEECDVLPLLRSGEYRFLDRNQPGLSPEQIREIFLQSFGADVYLCSANAVTEHGEIYCVDGNGNRIAALCYGPDSVIMVVGCNKLVSDLEEAQRRVKTVAAPLNAQRLQRATPCAATGTCFGTDQRFCSDGCAAGERICCSYLTLGYQRTPGRIKVILVAEPLGF